MSQVESTDVDLIVQDILKIKKYREIDLTEITVRDLLEKELPQHRQTKEAVKAVKKKLHHIVADYLGDLDYRKARKGLADAFQSGDSNLLKDTCQTILEAHASTKERLPIINQFYSILFEITGQPRSILDLACGLHPFSLPWMGLPVITDYYAYDIHHPRIDLINYFLIQTGMQPHGVVQDILVEPPRQSAEVAFFFKEAHRFEQRQKGSNRSFWQALNVRWLLVSLPVSSLSGKHNLIEQHRRLVYETIKGLPWPVTEVLIENELVFCINKVINGLAVSK